jgi:hypothetical protein
MHHDEVVAILIAHKNNILAHLESARLQSANPDVVFIPAIEQSKALMLMSTLILKVTVEAYKSLLLFPTSTVMTATLVLLLNFTA